MRHPDSLLVRLVFLKAGTPQNPKMATKAAAVLSTLALTSAQVQLPSWNDTFCHSPETVLASGVSCVECCTPEAAGFTIKGWTGGDTTTSWYSPMTKPWYNMYAFSADSCEHDGQTRPMCSACIDREIDDFREIMNSKPIKSPTTPECVCDASKTWEDGCPGAPAPFVVDCATWCCGAWKAQFLCQLPPVGLNPVPGSCAEYNARKLKPTAQQTVRCTPDGFYNDIQTGVVPPPFPPRIPNPQPLPGNALQAWCTDPVTGIQNGSSAVPAARSAELNCADTVQCSNMPKTLCLDTVGAKYCHWIEPIGAYGGAGCLPIDQAVRCEAVLQKLCPAPVNAAGQAACLTCAGKQQAVLRSVACSHTEISSHCTKAVDDVEIPGWVEEEEEQEPQRAQYSL